MRERVRGHAGLLPPDREVAAVLHLDAQRKREPVQQCTGGHQVEADSLGVLLEARGRVEDVPDEDDLLPEVAQLAGGHGAAMEPAAKAGHGAEVVLVPASAPLDGGPDREKASDAVGRAGARLDRPGDHDLVPRVLIDVPLRLEHRLRQVVDEAAEQLEVSGAAQSLRELCGALEVEEEKDALLRLRPVVDAGREIAQDVRANHAVHLEDELDREREHGEERYGIGQVGVGEARDKAPWLAARDHLPGGAAHEEQREHDRATERQIRPESEPSEPRAQRAVADGHQVTGHEQRDDDAVDQALDRRLEGCLTGQDIEDGRDHTHHEHDRRELPPADP